MSYHSKLIAAHEELEQAGIWKSNFNPPLFRLLRKLGVKYPPPYYRSFQSNFLTSFVFFTPGMGDTDVLFGLAGKRKINNRIRYYSSGGRPAVRVDNSFVLQLEI